MFSENSDVTGPVGLKVEPLNGSTEQFFNVQLGNTALVPLPPLFSLQITMAGTVHCLQCSPSMRTWAVHDVK